MRVYFKNSTVVTPVDPYCPDSCLRIQPNLWVTLQPIRDQYIDRPRNLSYVIAHLRAAGFRTTLQKLKSRLSETRRNDKYLGFGVGRVLSSSGIPAETMVCFLCYNHCLCSDQVVVHRSFVTNWTTPPAWPTTELWYFGANQCRFDDGVLAYRGWSEYSGQPLDQQHLQTTLDRQKRIVEEFLQSSPKPTLKWTLPEYTEPRETHQFDVPPKGCIETILFGYGNYAKSMVLPALSKHLSVRCIHEIDPLQMPLRGARYHLDSCPTPRPHERGKVWLIAGYHHTHAELAGAALRRGVVAVVEKPLATTLEQLNQFRQVLTSTKGTFYQCLQRRYLPFNEYLYQDLEVNPGAPLHYYCIIFEEQLPRHHWYRWPNSGSRLVSNGCHWIDHFMHLNQWSPAIQQSARINQAGDYIISMELANGACLSMVITESGSPRLGVREYVRVSHAMAHAEIIDCWKYRAEHKHRVVRSTQLAGKHESIKIMYKFITDRIRTGSTGDALQSLHSMETVLTLEETLGQSATISD